jgi:hypothetical protein
MPNLQHPFDALIEQIAEAVAQRLGPQSSRAPAAPKRRRKMSAEGIERIRAGAKKRWAKYWKEQAAK